MAAQYSFVLIALVKTTCSHGAPAADVVPSAAEASSIHLESDEVSRILNSSPADTERAIISIPISVFTLALRISNEDGLQEDLFWSDLNKDLEVVASAAEDYVASNSLLELALTSELTSSLEGKTEEGSSILQYEGVDFTAAAPTGERRTRILLRSSQRKTQATMNVFLSGDVYFSTPQQVNPLSSGAPSEEDLYLLVTDLFIYGEGATQDRTFTYFLNSAALREGASAWLTRVDAYETVRSNDINFGDSTGPPDNAALEKGETNGNESNIFIIVGVAGAALSMLLLIGGLVYAKRKYNTGLKSGQEGRIKPSPKIDTKNNPTNSRDAADSNPPASKGILKNPGSGPQNKPSLDNALEQARPVAQPPIEQDENFSDDESNAEFFRARAALTSSTYRPRSGLGGGASVVSAANTFTDDMSYAFSVEAESIAAATRSTMDDAVGAGGISSFRNERGGVFQWNDDGTKMVYTPANGHATKTQNGFFYDEGKKKWVVADKNVSFRPTRSAETPNSTMMTPPRAIRRSRTDESCVTGVTEFSYDDIALDFARRTRSGISLGEMSLSPKITTPDEEGVEVMPQSLFESRNEGDANDDEFISNTHVGNFISDDDSTAFGSVLTGLTSSNDVTNEKPKLAAAPHPVTPEPNDTVGSEQVHDSLPKNLTSHKNITAAPPTDARIDPVANSNSNLILPSKANYTSDDAPSDEDVPFDEISSSKQNHKPSQAKYAPKEKLMIPSIMDDESDSEGSADSAEVLEDLNTLSKFMKDRKQSTKKVRDDNKSSLAKRFASYSVPSRDW